MTGTSLWMPGSNGADFRDFVVETSDVDRHVQTGQQVAAASQLRDAPSATHTASFARVSRGDFPIGMNT